jgi:hypothetical protein
MMCLIWRPHDNCTAHKSSCDINRMIQRTLFDRTARAIQKQCSDQSQGSMKPAVSGRPNPSSQHSLNRERYDAETLFTHADCPAGPNNARGKSIE